MHYCPCPIALAEAQGDREENLPTHSHLTHCIGAGDMAQEKCCKWGLTWLTYVTAYLTNFHQARGWRGSVRDVSTFTFPVMLWVLIICSFLAASELLCPHPSPLHKLRQWREICCELCPLWSHCRSPLSCDLPHSSRSLHPLLMVDVLLSVMLSVQDMTCGRHSKHRVQTRTR